VLTASKNSMVRHVVCGNRVLGLPPFQCGEEFCGGKAVDDVGLCGPALARGRNAVPDVADVVDVVRVRTDAEFHALPYRAFHVAPVQIKPLGIRVYLYDYAVCGAGVDDFLDVDIERLPREQQPPCRVAED